MATMLNELQKPSLYINRELSWIEFNARVLELANDPTIPLLERVKFLAIFASNFDEFFMIRVAAQMHAIEDNSWPSGRDQTPGKIVMQSLSTRFRRLVKKQSQIWDQLHDELAKNRIHVCEFEELTEQAERDALTQYFNAIVMPVLTPLAVGPSQPFPYISGLSVNLGVMVTDDESGEGRFARIKVPSKLPRLLEMRLIVEAMKSANEELRQVATPAASASAGTSNGEVVAIAFDNTDEGEDEDEDIPKASKFVTLESVIKAHLHSIFPGVTIGDTMVFRITRDADLDLDEDTQDVIEEMSEKLKHRRFGGITRVEISATAPPEMVELLLTNEKNKGEIIMTGSDLIVHRVPHMIDLTALFKVASLHRLHLRYLPWKATVPKVFKVKRGKAPQEIFKAIRKNPILVFHPYHDFSSTVVRFLQLAVKDPDVLAIKHTMYRTNRSSPVIQALMAAAEMGKQVVCLMEIKARFDERNNMKWARALEKAGVHVMYGPPELKIHSKLALVVRRESNRTRRYAHIGTGNYNPSTAKIYSDFGLFTCQDDITADIANLFNHLTGFSKPPTFSRLLVSPHYMREGLFNRICSVTEQSRNGRVGCCIQIKCNSLLDGPTIEMLYLASRAGVQVQVISRGITALLPGVEGVSENIRVVSVVGRLLEHARVYIFHYGKGLESEYFIGSADLMPRNLDRRIEVLAPLDDPRTQKQVQWVINTQLRDTALAWELGPNKKWKCIRKHIDRSQALTDSQSAAVQKFGNSRKRSKL